MSAGNGQLKRGIFAPFIRYYSLLFDIIRYNDSKKSQL